MFNWGGLGHPLTLYIMRLDYKETFPSGMENYIAFYGWHFSKNMCMWACNKMYKTENGTKEYIMPYTKESFLALERTYGITMPFSYDALYVANMCKADFLGSSIKDEEHLLLYVKDVMEDPDGYEGMPFTRFYADCIGKGIQIDWDDVV